LDGDIGSEGALSSPGLHGPGSHALDITDKAFEFTGRLTGCFNGEPLDESPLRKLAEHHATKRFQKQQ
jgi:hypothetical protein